MGRKKKLGFSQPKMFSARVESSDYDKLEYMLKTKDGKTLQEFVNIIVRSYVSGTIHLSGSTFVSLEKPNE